MITIMHCRCIHVLIYLNSICFFRCVCICSDFCHLASPNGLKQSHTVETASYYICPIHFCAFNAFLIKNIVSRMQDAEKINNYKCKMFRENTCHFASKQLTQNIQIKKVFLARRYSNSFLCCCAVVVIQSNGRL